MDGRNSTALLETSEGKETRYEALSVENEYLRDENKRLHEENEQLREVFRIATVEFERRKKDAGSLTSRLEQALSTIKKLTEENAQLKARLETEEGR